MIVGEIETFSYITKSKLPDADYVVNPYLGCPHKCIYCYAEFMKRFSAHQEDWGDFVDVKITDNGKTRYDKLPEGKTVLFGSVTDPYNAFEKKYELSRAILQRLVDYNGRVEILTKSDLVMRDIDVIKKLKNAVVGISLNTLDDHFRDQIEPHAPSVERRIEAIKALHAEGVQTYLFVSPIFPEITNIETIVEALSDYASYVCFENLNLRGSYLPRVLGFIDSCYPSLRPLYNEIYREHNVSYWQQAKSAIKNCCERRQIEYRIYFNHGKS